jgi:hypothetical protein
MKWNNASNITKPGSVAEFLGSDDRDCEEHGLLCCNALEISHSLHTTWGYNSEIHTVNRYS